MSIGPRQLQIAIELMKRSPCTGVEALEVSQAITAFENELQQFVRTNVKDKGKALNTTIINKN